MKKDFTYKELCGRLAKGLNFPQNSALIITHLDGEEFTNYTMNGKIGEILTGIDYAIKDILTQLDDDEARIAREGLKQTLIEDEERRF